MGAGIDMKKGDIAFKCNFAFIRDGIVVSRRADRHFEDVGPKFCASLNGIKIPDFPDHEVTVQYATEHRCGIRVRGLNLTDSITDTDPLKDNLKLLECKPKGESKEAILTSKLVNHLSMAINEILEKHSINEDRRKLGKDPANIILFRGCGVRIDVPSFEEMHKMKGFMIAPTAIIKGLGLSLEMDIVESNGGTGDYRTNLEAKEIAFIKAMKSDAYDFGFLHIKAVDDCGHDKNFKLKVEFLEKIDKMLNKLLKELESINDGDWIVLLTGDHSTPCLYGDHSVEPVPFTICKLKDGPKDKVEYFNEIDAAYGELGRFTGNHVFDLVHDLRKPSV
jgi:2,3-diphosphopglycerate-independent phosphoglycerate mutase